MRVSRGWDECKRKKLIDVSLQYILGVVLYEVA